MNPLSLPRCFFFVALFFHCCAAFAQLNGRLVDAQTGEPVAGATVYINSTQLSTQSDAAGRFRFGRLPANWTLVVSHVAYEKLAFSNASLRDTLVLQLRTRDAALDNLVVKARAKDGWRKWGQLFLDNFIGSAGAQEHCRILNPEALRFYYNNADYTLRAWSKQPLLIRNDRLGYLLHVDLNQFSYSFQNGIFSYATSQFFEPLPTGGEAGRSWAANRLLAYKGSKMHFVRALHANRLQEEGFRLYTYRSRLNAEKARVKELLLHDKARQNEASRQSVDNVVNISSLRKDSIRYYNAVMQQADYFFTDTLSAAVARRRSLAADGSCRFDFGSDSLLLEYAELPADPLPEKQLRKWTRLPEESVAAVVNYNFFQGDVSNHRFTLLYLKNDTSLLFERSGYIRNKSSLFTEGHLAERRIAYDLPWDYEPVADYNGLRGIPAATEPDRAEQLTETLTRAAAARRSSTLYLHIDKTLYDYNENIWFAAYLLRSDAEREAHHTLYAQLTHEATGKVVARQQFVLDEGLSAGYFFLADSLPSGRYILSACTNTIGAENGTLPFQQVVSIRPQVPAFRVLYQDELTQVAGDSVHFRFRVKNEKDLYAAGARVKYSLLAGGKSIARGTAVVNDYGEVDLRPLHLREVSGKKLELQTTVDQNRQQEQFAIPVPFAKNFVRLHCYPEGGSLVGGFAARMALEATDLNGQPLSLEGSIEEEGKPVADFRTDAAGVGLAQWLPAAGKAYRIRMKNGNDRLLDFRFPAVDSLGYGLHVPEGVVTDSLRVQLRTSFTGQPLYLLVHNYEKAFAYSRLAMPAALQWLALPAAQFPEGFFTLTLFDAEGRPVAERSLYRAPAAANRIRISFDSAAYHNRSKIAVRIKATDAAGQPLAATFSLSCVLAHRLDTTSFQDIGPYALQSRYRALGVLGGQLAALQHPAQVEQLLLTKGWTRYRWNELAGAGLGAGFPMETGGVVSLDGAGVKKPLELLVFHDKGMSTLNTDSSGRFRLAAALMTTGPDQKAMLYVNDTRTGYSVRFYSPEDTVQALLAALEPPAFLQSAAPVAPEPADRKRLAMVTVKAKVGGDEAPYRFHQAHAYRSRSCTDRACMYNILNCVNHPVGMPPVDGERYYVRTLTGFETMTYVADPACASVRPGASKGTFVFPFRGRMYTKEFYVADYAKYNPAAPEVLTTLYWKPLVQTDARGEAEVQFYSNDLPGTFILTAEGIVPGGVISGRAQFRVTR